VTPAGAIVLHIQCSAKGNHPRIDLGNLMLLDGDLEANQDSEIIGWHAKQRAGDCVWVEEVVSMSKQGRISPCKVHLKCPRCSTHVQWRSETAVDRMTRLHEAGVSELDVSRIPSS
jgi:hypothetical protein